MAEQPAKENTKGQDINITQDTHETQDTQTTQYTHNTQDTHNTQQTDLTREFLAHLGLASDTAASGGLSETQARASARAPISEAGVVGVRFSDGTPRPSGSQQTNTLATASLTREVNCLPCNGCCGNRRGRRLPVRVYEFVAWVASVRGVPMCQVVNEFPELFCVGGSGRGHGLGRVKELERLLSREGQYKGSYIVKRLGECTSDNVCVHYVRLGVEGWLRLWFYLNGRALGDGVVESYLGRIAKSLGFSGVVELVRYLRLVVQGLVVEYPTDRHAGYKDILEVGCGLCGTSFRTTDPLPAFIVKLVRHFQVVHGLGTAEDVKNKVEELVVRELDRRDKPKVHPALKDLVTERLLNALVGVLVAIGLLEEAGDGGFRCVLDGVVVNGAPGVVAHVLDYHHDVVRDVKHLLEARGGAHGGEGSK